MVTSAKMQKTIVVKVTRATQHPLYERVMRSAKKYYAHDDNRRGQGRRHGSDRGYASAFQAEAVAAEGSDTAFDARRIGACEERVREHDNGPDADMADGGR